MKLKTLTFVVLSLYLSLSLKAQWTTTFGPGAALSEVFFTSNDTGYIAGPYVTTYKTVNGGSTWNSLASTGLLIEAFFFTTDSVGYIAGANETIKKTNDAASSWITQNSVIGSPKSFFDITFPSKNIGFAVGSSGLLKKTVNGGTNWTVLSSGTSQTLYSVYFINDTIGYISGNLGLIKKTVDGGLNWITQTTGITDLLYGIYFSDILNGYAVGGFGTILKTSDGGTTWILLPKVTNAFLSDIVFVDADTGYIVGFGGTILKTINAGTNWRFQPTGLTTNLHSISFANALTGYIAGSENNGTPINGIVLKTTNAGGPTYSCNPVFITSQPTSVITCVGNSATFTIGAYGSPPYSYRWYKNGALVDSSISSLNTFNSYTTASLTSADSGSIVYCIISNKCWDNTTSQIASDSVNLAVNPVCTPVSLVNGLGNIYYTIGISSYPIMSITVAGTPPFIYNWYSGSTLVQTDTLYSTNCTYQQWPALIFPGSIYSISCTVTNCTSCGSGSGGGAGSVTSFGSLTVDCPYTYINSHPINQSKSTCQTATFSVSLYSGSPSLEYAWFKNGTYIPGTSGPFNSSYTTPALTSADNGNTYYCKVTWCNGIMMNQSNTATLTIIQPASIVQQPTNQNLQPGTTATFNASVNGPPPFSYYWYTNGVLSSSTLNTSSTTTSFTTPLLSSGDISNSYYCIITNGAGCYTITSDTAHFNCASFNSISPTACDSFSINGQTFTNSGIYTQTLMNQNGCDSILTINLTVTNLVDTILQNGATLSSSIAGASYQWVDCENAMAAIPGATNQIFNPTANGYYALVISKGLCVDTSICYNVNSVGINKLDFENGISIFPSQVKNVLQITSTSLLIYEINLYNSIGALLIEQKQNKKQLNIDLSSYANGVYFIEIKTDKGNLRKKLIKE